MGWMVEIEDSWVMDVGRYLHHTPGYTAVCTSAKIHCRNWQDGSVGRDACCKPRLRIHGTHKMERENHLPTVVCPLASKCVLQRACIHMCRHTH